MYFQVYKDVRGQWRWTLKASNHVIVATSSDGYLNKGDCLHGIELVKSSFNASVFDI